MDVGPSPPDRTVGRAAEIGQILGWLDAGDRLVTITGLAGMGKTRLAQVVAARWPGDVRWVDASGVRTAEALSAAVGAALGAERADGDAVRWALQGQGGALVVLDGADAFDPAARAALAAWVAAAPEIRVLATGLRPLTLRGERRLTLGPLDGAAATAWLADQARDADPDTLAALAEALDGMPLALEIAGARLGTVPPGEVLRRVRAGLGSLVGDEADRPERHRSLAAAVGASAALLSPASRRALSQLTVFRGGFPLAGAREVLGDDAAERLRDLVDAALVRYDGVQRYLLPGPVAATVGPADVDAEARHGAWCVSLCEAGDVDPIELDNVYAAFDRAAARGDPAVGPLALGVAAVRRRLGPASAAVAALERADALSAGAPWRERVRIALGGALREIGRPDAAAEVLERAVQADEPLEVLVEAWLQLGWTREHAGRPDAAAVCFERALASAREAGSGAAIARALGSLGLLSAERDPAAARVRYREALAEARRARDPVCEGTVLSNLALLDRQEGRFDLARAGFEAARATARGLGHRRAEGRTQTMLGAVLAEAGDVSAARDLVQGALNVHRQVGDKWYEAVATGILGRIALGEGDLFAARDHLERAREAFLAVGHDAAAASAVGNLGSVRLAAGDAAGAAQAFEEALAAARRCGDRPQIGVWLGASGRAAASGPGSRSERAGRARALLGEAEAVLREVGPRTELGLVLCARAEVEAALGDAASAQILRDEAAELVAAMGLGPRAPLAAAVAALGPAGRAVRVAADGARFAFAGAEVDLSRRHAIRRVLVALVEARRAAPGAPLDVDALFAAGWPDQRAVPDAARERVYHAIGTLRRLGLGDVLERGEGGWRLDPRVPVEPG